jgi:serine protease Do
VTPVTPALRTKYELDDKAKGLLVTEVEGDSAAADKGLQAADIIIEAGKGAVTEVKQLQDAVATAKKDGKPILLLVERAGDARFIALPIK